MRQKYKGADVKARLNNTIIRYKNFPYLAEVNESGVISLRDITTRNLVATVDSDDQDLDISSIPLGYVNVLEKGLKLAVYLRREPLRRFKQGVEIETLSQKPLKDGVSIVPAGVLYSTGLVDAIIGRYPDLDSAISMTTKNGWSSVALSRDVALKYNGGSLNIYIKDSEVGYLKLGTKLAVVPKTDTSNISAYILSAFKFWEVKEGLK